MRNLIIVDNPKSWPLRIPTAEVVSARDYLVETSFGDLRHAAVYNLCRSYRHHSLGFYVSLMAEARRHRPLPSVQTRQDLRQGALLRIVDEEIREVAERALGDQPPEPVSIDVFFGATRETRLSRLARALFNRFPAPFLRIELRKTKAWHLEGVRLLSAGEIPEDCHTFVVEQAERYFARPRTPSAARGFRYELAILVNQGEVDAPSDEGAIQRFVRAAEKLGLAATIIGKDDIGNLAEFDALFLRETTYMDHHTYRFAHRAAAEGLVVIDDPVSIARCTNKVFQAEIFARNKIPSPRTVIVHQGNAATVAGKLGFPCVLKRPDSSFSLGVSKATDAADLKQQLASLLDDSELVVAQEWVPSEFDWRVGVLGTKPLYVCKYFMARGHWQIQKNLGGARRRYGKVEALPLTDVSPALLDLACRATALVGTGLYGVDIKEIDGRFLVMEVNDNPSIEAGVEDQVLKDDLYAAVMRHFVDALEAQRGDAAHERA